MPNPRTVEVDLMKQKGRPKSFRTPCNTKRNIVVPFRLSWKEYQVLIQQAGGRGKVGFYVREKLGIKNKDKPR